MSLLIRSEIFDWLIGSVAISSNPAFNWALAIILNSLLYAITFIMVRKLYSEDVIGGSLAGKISYFILYIINIFVTAGILRIIKFLISIYNYAAKLPGWIWILAVGMMLLIGALIIIRNKQRAVQK